MSSPEQTPYRSGFVALVGRPNAGKTTLTNALVGEKVGIVSNRPQTTRHAIRGVVHKPEDALPISVPSISTGPSTYLTEPSGVQVTSAFAGSAAPPPVLLAGSVQSRVR